MKKIVYVTSPSDYKSTYYWLIFILSIALIIYGGLFVISIIQQEKDLIAYIVLCSLILLDAKIIISLIKDYIKRKPELI